MKTIKIIELNNLVWENLFLTTDALLYDITILEVLKYFHGLKHFSKNEFEVFDARLYFKFKNDYNYLIKGEFERNV